MNKLKHLKLVELKGLLHSISEKERLSCTLFSSGIPKGAITQVTSNDGAGKTEFILKFLSEHPNLKAAWIEDELSIYPRSFPQAGVDLSRVLFIQSGKKTHWVALQALRSRLFGVVVLCDGQLKGTELKRIQLAAEQGGAAVIILSSQDHKQSHFSVTLSLNVQRRSEESLDVQPIKGSASWMKSAH